MFYVIYGPASEHGYLELTCYVPANNWQLSEAGNSTYSNHVRKLNKNIMPHTLYIFITHRRLS